MNIDNFLYHYVADVVSVYDGDTIRVSLDLGFGLTWEGSTKKGLSLRLYGINTPEVRGDERDHGLMVRDKLRDKILGKKIIVNTIKDKTGKYGRYLAVIYDLDGTNINEWLVENGWAEKVTY
jgi:micrococcal nuclease